MSRQGLTVNQIEYIETTPYRPTMPTRVRDDGVCRLPHHWTVVVTPHSPDFQARPPRGGRSLNIAPQRDDICLLKDVRPPGVR